MITRTRALAAGLAVSCLVVVAACGNSGSPPAVPTTKPSSSTTSPTSAPTQTLSPAEQDAKAASQTITRFWSMLDKLASDPYLSLGQLATVASDQAIAQWRSNLTGQRYKQWKQIGRATVASSGAKATSGNTFEVTACIDVSKVNVVDKNGKSVVAAGRPSRVQYTYKVTKIPSGFFVTKDTLEGKPC